MFKLREICHPTFILMIVGFFISFMALCIGISYVDMILKQLYLMDNGDTPIFDVMRNSGIMLSLQIYLFSIVNCLVSTNYWIINKERELSIYKAFGWSGIELIGLIVREFIKLLLICLFISLLTVMAIINIVEINLFFIISMIVLLAVTLFIFLIIPVYRILRLSPAEVIK